MMRQASLAATVALGALIAGIAAAPSPAVAAEINMMGYVGPIAFIFNSYESFVDSSGNLATTLAVGDQNFGTFNVTSIIAQANYGSIMAGQPIWQASASNGILAGVFNDIKVSRLTTISPFEAGNTGGHFQLYNLPLASFPNFSQGTNGYLTGGCTNFNTLCYNTITNVALHTTPVLTMDLIPGADTTVPTETLLATTNTTTIPLTGSAAGWMDITGGSDAFQFGRAGFTTAIGTPADMSLFDDFCPNVKGCGGQLNPTGNWQQVNFDPVGATAIPEPVSLALLGTGLVGMGFAGRRRRNREER
jgi:PEP-CTERM motif